uniref:Uncharacterized protein n=1 Tax=Siphoviridae sp. ctL0q1 TaxID=2825449 RepID=A0A8S5PJH2_9CAUD|nr:MAG TPA: hypothetical protein [Siphoviridae sp. ctL0q1]
MNSRTLSGSEWGGIESTALFPYSFFKVLRSCDLSHRFFVPVILYYYTLV